MAERKIALGSKDTEIRAGNVRLKFEKDERPSVSGLRFSKSLSPLLEPIIRCRGVRVSLRPVERIEDTINVRGRNTYLLYDPSEKTKGSVAKPKYLMMLGEATELPAEAVADTGKQRLFLNFEITPSEISYQEEGWMLNISGKVTALDISIGEMKIRVVPIESSFVVNEVQHNVRVSPAARVEAVESRPKEEGLAGMEIVDSATGEMTTIGELMGGKISARKIEIQPNGKVYTILLMSSENGMYLFVRDNNLENLIDLSPVFLALELGGSKRKYMMEKNGVKFYGAKVADGGEHAIKQALGVMNGDSK